LRAEECAAEIYNRLVVSMSSICLYFDLGIVPYDEALAIQRRLVELRRSNSCQDILLLLEHPPVLTIGRSGGEDQILVPRSELERQGVPIVHTNRGGSITYHGPGQLVGYPILDLENLHKDAHWYLRCLEMVLIDTLKKFGIEAVRIPGRTGVWVNGEKIASIGVAIRHWITMHGFALNINPDLEHLRWINPCGLSDAVMTSLARLCKSQGRELLPPEVVKRSVVRELVLQFGTRFNREMVAAKWEEFRQRVLLDRDRDIQ